VSENDGSKREEVGLTKGSRKQHDEEFHNSHPSQNRFVKRIIKSRSIRCIWNEARIGEMRNPYRILVGISKGKRHFAIPRSKWEDINKNDFK
jgi:hypothetical protein